MRIGLQVPEFNWPGNPQNIGTHLADIFLTADEAGFYSLWVMDHLFQIGYFGSPDQPMLEAYSALSYAAAVTQRAKLGTLVTGVVYRHPGVLVKQVTTLDVLSGGRAYLGIGAAWFDEEAQGLGIPFPPLRERFERLEETLQIAHQMWRGDTSPYNGQHYQLTYPLNNPPALTQPHPSILIGGEGERKTLRLVAQYADACNLFAGSGLDNLEGRLAEMRHKLDVLRRHCDDVGRPYEAIEKTALATVHLAPGQMTPQDVITLCRALAEVGIQHLIINMPNTADITPLETFATDIIPAVADL